MESLSGQSLALTPYALTPYLHSFSPPPQKKLFLQFNIHVIIETNKTTQRIFPEVIDCENPQFQRHLDNLVELNQKLVDIGRSGAPGPLQLLQKLPVYAGFAAELLGLWLLPPLKGGSYELENKAALVY